jgi:hypothetical protein
MQPPNNRHRDTAEEVTLVKPKSHFDGGMSNHFFEISKRDTNIKLDVTWQRRRTGRTRLSLQAYGRIREEGFRRIKPHSHILRGDRATDLPSTRVITAAGHEGPCRSR